MRGPFSVSALRVSAPWQTERHVSDQFSSGAGARDVASGGLGEAGGRPIPGAGVGRNAPGRPSPRGWGGAAFTDWPVRPPATGAPWPRRTASQPAGPTPATGAPTGQPGRPLRPRGRDARTCHGTPVGARIRPFVQFPSQGPWASVVSPCGGATYDSGRSAFQAECREFESHRALHPFFVPLRPVALPRTNGRVWRVRAADPADAPKCRKAQRNDAGPSQLATQVTQPLRPKSTRRYPRARRPCRSQVRSGSTGRPGRRLGTVAFGSGSAATAPFTSTSARSV